MDSNIVRKVKVHITARISALAEALMQIEKLPNESTGEFLDRLIITNSSSDEALELILQETEKDRHLSAIVQALRRIGPAGISYGSPSAHMILNEPKKAKKSP